MLSTSAEVPEEKMRRLENRLMGYDKGERDGGKDGGKDGGEDGVMVGGKDGEGDGVVPFEPEEAEITEERLEEGEIWEGAPETAVREESRETSYLRGETLNSPGDGWLRASEERFILGINNDYIERPVERDETSEINEPRDETSEINEPRRLTWEEKGKARAGSAEGDETVEMDKTVEKDETGDVEETVEMEETVERDETMETWEEPGKAVAGPSGGDETMETWEEPGKAVAGPSGGDETGGAGGPKKKGSGSAPAPARDGHDNRGHRCGTADGRCCYCGTTDTSYWRTGVVEGVAVGRAACNACGHPDKMKKRAAEARPKAAGRRKAAAAAPTAAVEAAAAAPTAAVPPTVTRSSSAGDRPAKRRALAALTGDQAAPVPVPVPVPSEVTPEAEGEGDAIKVVEDELNSLPVSAEALAAITLIRSLYKHRAREAKRVAEDEAEYTDSDVTSSLETESEAEQTPSDDEDEGGDVADGGPDREGTDGSFVVSG